MLQSTDAHDPTPHGDLPGRVRKVQGQPDAMEIDFTPKLNTLRDVKHVYETFRVVNENYSSKNFQGYCVDTSATSTVIGCNQALAYFNHAEIDLKLGASKRTFKLADTTFKSLGKLPSRIPTPNDGFIE